MRVLLIKTSSMGDLIHTLPALTDAGKAIPGIIFDWVVEESYADLPKWHPLVDRVIPISLRRWRKQPIARTTFHEWRALRERLAQKKYDLILDAQGLVKSAFLTYATKGVRAGLDFQSAREGLASFAYQRKCKVNFYQHAVMRMRLLFSQALHYPLSRRCPILVSVSSNFKRSPRRKIISSFCTAPRGRRKNGRRVIGCNLRVLLKKPAIALK